MARSMFWDGHRDKKICFEPMVNVVGQDLSAKLREMSLSVSAQGANLTLVPMAMRPNATFAQ
ncbi:MAG: hypothetical protein MK102_17790 [Fuerstiella sp.]|nr:hypothetical protein [Fuerstiella sp.]